MGIPKNSRLRYYNFMISKEDIEGLAQLARLKLASGEAESLQKDISNILGYVGQVQSFSAESTKERAPLLHNVLRADEPRQPGDPLFNKEEALVKAFPKQENGYNVVRKIIQKDE